MIFKKMINWGLELNLKSWTHATPAMPMPLCRLHGAKNRSTKQYCH